jgi:hypothetical protein
LVFQRFQFEHFGFEQFAQLYLWQLLVVDQFEQGLADVFERFFDQEVAGFEHEGEEVALKQVEGDFAAEDQRFFIVGGHQLQVFLLALDHKEDHLVEGTVTTQQKGFHLLDEIFAVGEKVDTLQRDIIGVAGLNLLVEADHVGLEFVEHFDQRGVVFGVVVFVGEVVLVEVVDVDRGEDLQFVHGVVLVGDRVELGEVVF